LARKKTYFPDEGEGQDQTEKGRRDAKFLSVSAGKSYQRLGRDTSLKSRGLIENRATRKKKSHQATVPCQKVKRERKPERPAVIAQKGIVTSEEHPN